MIQNQIDFEFKILNFLDDPKDAAQLSEETPINRVPILVDQGQKIFDSRVIVNHLIKKHALPALSIEEENQVSVVYSCLDTALILFQMKKDGFDINKPGFFISRQLERIPRNLKYLDPWIRSLSPLNQSDWNLASISLFSFLFWADARELLDLNNHPTCKDFLKRFANNAGVEETTFTYK